MIEFKIPEDKKVRVIINADTKNEVDDQFAIVHSILTESFDLKGIIPTHFGDKKSKTSQQDSYDETMLLLELMNLNYPVVVKNGGKHALVDANTPVESDGARLIIDEAMKDDERTLYIAFLGPLTDMASALLMEPTIAKRNIKVIWIGGRDWPVGGWEYNLCNDTIAANIIFNSSLELWQVPRNVYRMMPVSFAELSHKVKPYGKIGHYLVEQLIEFNNAWTSRPTEYRILGDSPAIGLMIFDGCGKWSMKPAPEFDEEMNYIHSNRNREIRVYEDIDSRFILEDFYAKLALFTNDK